MRSFESVLGQREESSAGMFGGRGSGDREDVSQSITEKYNEKVETVLLLFEYEHYAKGWLVKTRSRLIFALTQDVNRFKIFLEIKWVIDDLQNTNFDLRVIDENETQIVEGKTILFDVGLYSQDRVLKEINKLIQEEVRKEISEEVRRKIEIHPKIWHHVIKMWDWYYDNRYVEVLHALPIKADPDPNNIKRTDGVFNFLSRLSLEDSLIVFKDILEHEEVKRDKYNNWNNFGDYIREWRPQLISYLNGNGIEYDEESKTFSLIGGEPIQILTSKRKLPALLEIEFNEFFYDNLKSEVNSTYRFGLFTSTMFLARKLLENLVIEILRIKYPPNIQGNLELYYNARDSRFYDFTILLKNLEERKDDFGVDKDIITEFISSVKPFRPRANSNAHSIIIVSDEDEVLSYNIPKMTALLLKLWNNIKQST